MLGRGDVLGARSCQSAKARRVISPASEVLERAVAGQAGQSELTSLGGIDVVLLRGVVLARRLTEHGDDAVARLTGLDDVVELEGAPRSESGAHSPYRVRVVVADRLRFLGRPGG